MNNKSRNIHAACASSTLGNLSDNKFLRDYYKMVNPYLDDDSLDDIEKTPNVERLLDLAKEEFIKSYDAFPTCAVCAPGCLTLAGKCTNLAESKSLSMAVQLVTLIVGKRRRDNKWCHVKTLSDEFAGENVCRFYSNDENLRISAEESSWVRYLKATIRCFKNKRVPTPGFEIVIASTVPIRCGLGSSSALVVAFYTFLEVITNTRTANVFEKTLVCHLAQKMATGFPDHRIADSLISIIGNEDEIITFDSRSLHVGKHDWQTVNLEMVLIGFPEFDLEQSANYRSDATRRKEISNIRSTISRWRTDPDGDMMKRLYQEETMTLTENIRQEDKRISKMIRMIETERWKQLGKLLWENYRYTRKSLNSLPDEVERVMTALESTDGVLGASFVCRGRGASVFALVIFFLVTQDDYLKENIGNKGTKIEIQKLHLNVESHENFETTLLQVKVVCWSDCTLYTRASHFVERHGVAPLSPNIKN